MELKAELVTPVKDNLLIKPYQGETTTEGGIELSDTAENSFPVLGKILAAGPMSSYTTGTYVMWRRYSLDELKLLSAGVETVVYLIADSDVLATYPESSTP